MDPHDQAAQAHAALVTRARAGDGRAWQELVHRYRRMLEGVTRRYRLTEADAADAVQTTWLRCVENLGAVRDPECLPAWLATTCRRECLRVVRRAGREVPHDPTDDAGALAAVPATLPDAFAGAARQDDVARLYAAVGDLPGHQRRVVLALLRHGDDGYAAISDRLGMPIGSLGPTRRRAFERLRLDERLQPAM